MDNFIYTPELNPVQFYDEDRGTSAVWQTPHFEEFPFADRSKPWLQAGKTRRVWQTTDIINLQFTSSFDPIVVSLVDSRGIAVITLPTLIGLPNRDYPNTFSFEVSMSLASVSASGCYRIKRTLGSGESQVVQFSPWMYVSTTPIPGTLLIQYKNSRFHRDVIFETGIEFWFRVPGWIDYDRITRTKKDEVYRDQKFTNSLLSAKSAKAFPAHFGDQFGLTSDDTNLIEEIFTCDQIRIDGRLVALSNGSLEYTEAKDYRQRGITALLEPGINRSSRVKVIGGDPDQKIYTSAAVDLSVFGDLGNNGNTNTVIIPRVVIN